MLTNIVWYTVAMHLSNPYVSDKDIDFKALPYFENVKVQGKDAMHAASLKYLREAKRLGNTSNKEMENQISELVKNKADFFGPKMMKLYLLLRFMYSIPKDATYSGLSVGGFVGSGRKLNGKTLVSWPVFDNGLGPEIQFDMGGIQGEPYHALADFKYVSTRFNRRNFTR